jgi:UDP-N-acetylmuramoyl-tripeptide--D-alanyl-D-alanine ligase
MWRAQDISEALNLFYTGPNGTGFSIDSRSLKAGEIFVALPGEHVHGVQFLKQAFEKGAGAALCPLDTVCSFPLSLIKVPDPVQALRQLAAYRRKQFCGTVLGVTGSMGKTTVKEGLRHLLAEKGAYASAASFNNHLGLPLSLTNLPLESTFGIFELGTNHPGEILDLVSLLKPKVSILTALSPAHIGHFGNMQAIEKEKSFIFQNASLGVLSQKYEKVMSSYWIDRNCQNILFYGPQTHIQIQEVIPLHEGCQVLCQMYDLTFSYFLTSCAPHWVANSLILVATLYGLFQDPLEVARLSQRLETFFPLKGRGLRRFFPKKGVWAVDESYNAAPGAMLACLEAFEKEPGRKILFLGQMGELGDHSQALHNSLIEPMTSIQPAHTFLIGPAFEGVAQILKTPTTFAPSVKELKKNFLQTLCKGDVILVKGSFSSQVSVALQWLEEEEKSLEL